MWGGCWREGHRKTPFSLKNFIAGMTCPTPDAPYIPRRWRPQSPAHPDRPHSTGSRNRPCQMQGRPRKARHTRPDAGNAAPVCTRYQTGRADRTGGVCWRAWCMSETVQIWTHSNMNDFQHKNVCKTVDINTRTCYYIDNTRTCYTTTKQEDKNHEKVLPRYHRAK